MIKDDKKLTIDCLKQYTEMTERISRKIHKILTLIEQKKSYNNLFWHFKVISVKFCNKDKVIYVITSDSEINNIYNINLREVKIPYKYLGMEDELLEELISPQKKKGIEIEVKKDEDIIKSEEKDEKNEYEEYLRLKKKYEKEIEKCVICGCPTDEYVTTHIDLRDCYVEGVGQLCKRCYSEYVVN